MKKILLFLILTLISTSLTFAREKTADEQAEELMKNIVMPSDEEIMKEIKTYNLTEEQAQRLYNKTKQKVKEVFENQDREALKEKLKQDIEKNREEASGRNNIPNE